MKIPYKHLLRNINSNPNIYELSEKLFQLGHEHDIINDEIFDMEFTPNKGDCISVRGILRDLSLFYDVSINNSIFEKEIESFQFEFINNAKKSCRKISFLKIQIEDIPSNYTGRLKDYFDDLDIKKNNFFTDVSNYVLYETGQPTHCYDYSKIYQPIKLDYLKSSYSFMTLLDKEIELQKDDLAFFNNDESVINFAGIVGGKNTSCDNKTKSVIVECAHFDPEAIIGKAIKHDINSEAAYRFERFVDPESHDYVLRRMLHIVNNHTKIRQIKLLNENFLEIKSNPIPFNIKDINKILGTNICEEDCFKYLKRLGFEIVEDKINIPSYRNDIKNLNDIAEEIARAVGYNNIKPKNFKITSNDENIIVSEENKLKKLLIDKGFFEVINDPFVSIKTEKSVVIDNPLDSTRKYLRTNLRQSLVENLSFNERRQKETIKLFEVSNIYLANEKESKRVIGIISSGRIDKNYLEFSKQINKNYLTNLFKDILNIEINIEHISRDSVYSKSKSDIFYIEIILDETLKVNYSYDELLLESIDTKVYKPISDLPSSNRDLSFSVKDFRKLKILENMILNFKHDLIKEVFAFDYYKNDKLNEIKIGFRLIFQSNKKTITEQEINEVINLLISKALDIESVDIPGLK